MEPATIEEVKKSFLTADLLKNLFTQKQLSSEEQLEKEYNNILNQIESLSEEQINELTKKHNISYSHRKNLYENLEWHKTTVSLEDIGVWPGMQELPLELTAKFSVLEIARTINKNQLEISKEFIEKIKIIKEHANFHNKFPLILLPSGEVRGRYNSYVIRKKLDKPECKVFNYDIDDGSSRAIALALAGVKEITAYVGKYRPNIKNIILNYPSDSNLKSNSILYSDAKFTIYDFINTLETNPIKESDYNLIKSSSQIPLTSIINIHNHDGIQSIERIKSMIYEINSGKHIFSESGIPNIKIAITKDNELILFDGHHSMLAYIHAGKKYLHEVPHLIIKDYDKEFISEEEMNFFFLEHSNKIPKEKWRDFTINWQNPIKEQVCKRMQKNIGELYDVIKIKLY